MNKLSNIKTIFFDFDGTIHNSIEIYSPAFKKAYNYLVELELVKYKEFRKEEISNWLGYNSKDMWNKFMPKLDNENKLICNEMIRNEMLKCIRDGKATLYEGALDVLDYLKAKDYKLVFLSNCSVYYMNAAINEFELNNYFTDFFCSEQFNQISKANILNKLIKNFKRDMVIVGDRFHDIEAGKENDIYTIGCSYGYGSKEEIQEADICVNNINELKSIL